MIRWFLRRQIAAFERKWNYNATYMRELLDADPHALITLGKAVGFGHYRKDVPLAPHYACAIVVLMAEDCGACTQLAIDMAKREGVNPDILRAIVKRDFTAIPYDVALVIRFTEASMRRASEVDGLRDEVVRKWGKRGLISLAFAMIGARLYPTLKYALGHGESCTRLRIEGDTEAVHREMTEAA